MAMKKKFLGLAMAAMVAIPATGVYAANVNTDGSQIIKSDTQDVQVDVEGSVLTSTGQKPEKIEVELPSKLLFTVDGTGNFNGATFDINNKNSTVGIAISVNKFTGSSQIVNGSNSGIEVVSKDKLSDEGKREQHYRNQISLELTKIASKTNETVDLADLSDNQLGTIKAGETAEVRLKGVAGKKDVETEHKKETTGIEDVDTNGAQANFELVFGISKVATPSS